MHISLLKKESRNVLGCFFDLNFFCILIVSVLGDSGKFYIQDFVVVEASPLTYDKCHTTLQRLVDLYLPIACCANNQMQQLLRWKKVSLTALIDEQPLFGFVNPDNLDGRDLLIQTSHLFGSDTVIVPPNLLAHWEVEVVNLNVSKTAILLRNYPMSLCFWLILSQLHVSFSYPFKDQSNFSEEAFYSFVWNIPPLRVHELHVWRSCGHTIKDLEAYNRKMEAAFQAERRNNPHIQWNSPYNNGRFFS